MNLYDTSGNVAEVTGTHFAYEPYDFDEHGRMHTADRGYDSQIDMNQLLTI